MQQLSASSGSHRRGADGIEWHRQGIAAGADETGRRRSDTQRSREIVNWHNSDQYASFLYNVVVGQRRKHRAKGRLPDEWLDAILDTAQEDIYVSDTRLGKYIVLT